MIDKSPIAPTVLTTSALGVAQIIVWGGSYFLVAVIADPIAADTGWPRPWIFGSLSFGILISGLLSPAVGRLIEHHGGRPVLAASAILVALGLLILGLAPSLPIFVLAWGVIGLGMAAGLYDPLFSALGQLYGENARGAITQVTLISGFATTICWPLTAFLIHHLGWRETCYAFTAALLAVVLPLYLIALPKQGGSTAPTATPLTSGTVKLLSLEGRVFTLLAAGFTVASVIMTAISVQLIILLEGLGVPAAAAVGLGALIGPSQVGARGIEILFGRKTHPVWSMLLSTVLVAVGLLLVVGGPHLAAVGIVLYGGGSGIRSIVRGTLPLAIFSRDKYAVMMGRLARPALIAQAATPLIGAYLLERHGPTVTMTMLCSIALLNIALVLALLPFVLRHSNSRPPH